VVSTPEVPVSPHASPMTLVIPVQCAVSVQVHTNAAVSTPDPSVPSVQVVIVVVPTVEVPVSSHPVPSGAIPALVDSQAVAVAAKLAVVIGPEPAGSLVVFVPVDEVPICTHATPVSLVVPEEDAQAIEVNADAPVPSPGPSRSTVEAVIVFVSPPQMPVAADIVPSTPIPAS
jgi:hypothetical protein